MQGGKFIVAYFARVGRADIGLPVANACQEEARALETGKPGTRPSRVKALRLACLVLTLAVATSGGASPAGIAATHHPASTFAGGSPRAPERAGVGDTSARSLVEVALGRRGAGDLAVAEARAKSRAADGALTRADLARMVLRVLGITPAPSSTGTGTGEASTGGSSPFVVTAWRLGFLPGDGTRSPAGDAAATAADLSSAVGALSRIGMKDVAHRLAASARTVVGGAFSRLSAARAMNTAPRYGAGGRATSASWVTVDGQSFPVAAEWTMRATAYSNREPGIGNRTATGMRVREGVVAVDPAVIPLGSLLYVQGYGFAVAADTGGAIRGRRIDLYVDGPLSRVTRFGHRMRKVYLIASPR